MTYPDYTETIAEHLAAQLKQARLSEKMTNRQASKESGVSTTVITLIENEHQVPKIAMCNKIAKAYGYMLAVINIFDEQLITYVDDAGDVIRKLRNRHEWSIRKHGELSGIAHAVLNRIETHKSEPMITTFQKLIQPMGYRLELWPITEQPVEDTSEEIYTED